MVIHLNELPSWTVPALVFLSVGLAIFVFVTSLLDRRKVQDRFAAAGVGGSRGDVADPRSFGPSFDIDPQKLGLDVAAQRQLRTSLIRAGHFGANAVAIYTIIRAVTVVAVPLGAYWFVLARFGHWSPLLKFTTVAVSFVVAYYLGQGYLDRRQRLLGDEYRLFFPDFLDMLVVCVDAGLSLEAALERVSLELNHDQRHFRINLQLMMAEMRAGKSTIEALRAFSERLGLSEAKSLVTLLQQSIELGTDVSLSLSTFSDEMREKRMSRAEEKAFALPVKITLPLALFILPTIFIVILTPAVIKISTTLLN